MPPPESVADQDPAPQVARQLGQRQPGRLDVVGGGVRPGVPGPQHDGQRLPVPAGAVVGEGGHGMEAEGLLPGRRRLLLLGVGDHDGGVQVDGDQAAARARAPRPRPAPRPAPGPPPGRPGSPSAPAAGPRPAALTSRDTTGSDATGPASSGCSRSTAMSARQSPPSATRGGQVRDDLARVVDRPRRPPPGQALRQAPAQAGDPHRLPQQHRPGLGHQPPAVSRHRHTATACAILHLESAFGSGTDRTLDKPYPPRSKALFSFV